MKRARTPHLRAAWMMAALIPWTHLGCTGILAARPESHAALELNLPLPPAPVLADGDLSVQSEAIFAEIPDRFGSHAPTIAALPDGTLLAAWYSYCGPGELDGTALYLARREPGAADWSQPALHLERLEALGNPVLYRAAESVWLFFAAVPGSGWSTARVEFQQSLDGGHRWSDPRPLGGPLGTNVKYPPVRLRDGSLLLPAYDDLWQRALFFRSIDGAAWDLRSDISLPPPQQPTQPALAALDDGRLLAVMRNTGRGWLWVAASDDDGRSWTQPQDSGFPNPASPAALLNAGGGVLVLIFNDSNTERRPLSAAVSGDAGRTWHAPRVLVDGDGEYAYPAAVLTADGRIHVLYSHARRYIGHVEFNLAWAADAMVARP